VSVLFWVGLGLVVLGVLLGPLWAYMVGKYGQFGRLAGTKQFMDRFKQEDGRGERK
jgi:membrane protein DedA with SNARE-associated domain